MKQFFLQSTQNMRFKRWKRSKSAIFKSLGKVISLASLTASVLAAFTGSMFAQIDTVFMQEIEISTSRMPQLTEETAKIIQSADEEELRLLPANNLHEVLGQVGAADIRSRGADGIQSDIAFRAGNFEQTLVLINGVALNDIQTGHHSLNLPLSLQDIRRVEILQGPGNRFYGLNAYSGAVNIITKRQSPASLSACYGSHNRLGLSGVATFGKRRFNGRLSGQYRQSDGYLKQDSINNTDYETANLFFSGRADMGAAPLLMDAGFARKAFGANDFYTPSYPWQYEDINSTFAILRSSFGDKFQWEPVVFWRRHQDRFELFREDVYERQNGFFIHKNDTAGFGGGYFYAGHNHHLTHVAGGKLTVRYTGDYSKSLMGIELRREQIFSNVLGEEMVETRDVPFYEYGEYTRSAGRLRGNFFAEYYVKKGKTAFSGGLALGMSDAWQPLLTGGIDLSYDLPANFRLYAAFNRTARLPSYTDLYYAGPVNIGNPDLEPETALNGEIGIKRHSRNSLVYLTGFYRYGQNTIDWAKANEADKWQSMNITELHTYGTEAGIQLHFREQQGFRYFFAAYGFAYMQKPESSLISKYVLDYLKHSLRVSSAYSLGRWDLAASFRAEDRAGSFIDYDTEGFPETDYAPFVIVDFKTACHLGPVTLTLSANNFFDTDYHEIASVQMPGRQFLVGLEWEIRKQQKISHSRL